jgi:FtsP/CotA-like multicopper oxidase with cupredoxin domain
MYINEFPGPSIIANTGSAATIRFVNGLSQRSITHWHGLIVDHEDDGHPLQAVDPGLDYNYNFTIAQRAALNWYHPHPHMQTGEQVFFGLTGAFIIRDSEEAALGLPSGSYEVPLIIRDASFDSSGNLKFGAKSSGFIGTDPLVNGTRNPYIAVDKAVYRFRILNGSNARVLRLALSNGASFTLIGNDGGLLPSAVALSQITLAPAERLDLLVDLRNLNQGTSIMLRCLDAGWDLLELRGTGAVISGPSIPTGSLSTITPLAGPATPTRTFSFDGMTRINGLVYDINRTDFTVAQGQVERWRFRTNGNAPHPVHIHGASFQIKTRTGGRGTVFPWESGWKDTVLLADRETVDVLIRFERTGMYLIHCHQLAHEDQGMMSNFVVQ